MKRWSLVFLVLVLTAAPALAAAPAGERPRPSDFEIGSREWFKAGEIAKYRWLEPGARTEDCPHSYDVLHYDITLFIDFENEMIFGDTKVLAVSQEDGLAQVDLDLTVLTVDAVLSGGDTLDYVYADPVLHVNLPEAAAPGDSFEVRVVYHGVPGNEGPGGFGGFYFDGLPVTAFQMGVGLVADPPSMGKYWFPCWDWPCDKATADFHVSVAGNRKLVVCNGTLVSAVYNPGTDRMTFDWSAAHEMAPHVMTVAARKYTEIVDSTYSWIHYWVFPPDEASARIHFSHVHTMMDAMIDRFGPYPFDKFGYICATKGDMEHQTCVTHNGYLVGPTHTYDWLLAHEMGHQWWGDCVSVNTWEDVWLSEGFGTYCESVFEEYAHGTAAYHAYVQTSYMTPVMHSGENFPMYDPVNLWGTTTYEKGAVVLHMLRHVLGDGTFFDALAAYRAAYEYRSATTAEFQAVCETASGRDLDGFFQEWVYDVGWPVYEYSWGAELVGGAYDFHVVIDQVQTNGPVFTMPVDVRVTTASGDTLVTLWVDGAHKSFHLSIAGEPTGVTLDPDNWILDESTQVAYTAVSDREPVCPGLGLEQNVPNPFQPSTRIAYSIPRAEDVRLDVFNARGQRVVTLLDGPAPAGPGQVLWDGRDGAGRRAAPGAYFCRLACEDGERVIRMVRLE